MPGGVTLADLKREVRAEIGHSLNVAQGVNYEQTLALAISRAQQELWGQHQWPSLQFRCPVPITASARYASYPTRLLFAPIDEMYLADGTANYTPIGYGIEVCHLNEYDSENNATSWPVRKWQHAPSFDVSGVLQTDAGQIELWPIPDRAGSLLAVSQALLPPLVADVDRCVLDSYAITMFASVAILARQKSEDATVMQGRATEYLRRLLIQQGARKRKITILGGVGSTPGRGPERPYIDYIPA